VNGTGSANSRRGGAASGSGLPRIAFQIGSPGFSPRPLLGAHLGAKPSFWRIPPPPERIPLRSCAITAIQAWLLAPGRPDRPAARPLAPSLTRCYQPDGLLSSVRDVWEHGWTVPREKRRRSEVRPSAGVHAALFCAALGGRALTVSADRVLTDQRARAPCFPSDLASPGCPRSPSRRHTPRLPRERRLAASGTFENLNDARYPPKRWRLDYNDVRRTLLMLDSRLSRLGYPLASSPSPCYHPAAGSLVTEGRQGSGSGW
jgi:hypothetical protein